MNMSRTDWREHLKRALRVQRKAQAARVEEYITEAEHQDGKEYWDQFESIPDVVADFDIYAHECEEIEAASDDGTGKPSL